MIGLDSNVLVRLRVGDDPGQSERGRRFVDQRCTPESPGFINCVVLAEVVLGAFGLLRLPPFRDCKRA